MSTASQATTERSVPRIDAAGAVGISGLRKVYGTHEAVADLNLTIRGGELFTLLGPSGSGKTTTLMMLAGFTDPSAGEIVIDDKPVTTVPPENRNIGFVFQSYTLFPHMTVAENVAFPLEMRRIPKLKITQKVKEVLDLVQLAGFDDKYPAELSGGQQQRTAVARAVSFNPTLLLMDEPLGALDRKLRAYLQVELRRLQQTLGVTVVYVTHDQDEAMSISDRIAVFNEGRIAQVGTAEELYEEPNSLFVAGFLGDNNVFNATALPSPTTVRLSTGVTIGCHEHDLGDGTAVMAAIRPERLEVRSRDDTHVAGLAGHVIEVLYLGASSQYTVDVPDVGSLSCRVPNRQTQNRWQTGDEVMLHWNAADLRIFPAGEA